MSETKLPVGWYETAAYDGVVDLRTSTSGRSVVVAGAMALVAFTAWNMSSRWTLLSPGAVELRFIIITLLTLFGIWCAFGDESWHIDRNRVEHRIGIGPIRFTRRIHEAELQVIERFGTKVGRPYYRLYAETKGKQRFLMDRKLAAMEGGLCKVVPLDIGQQEPFSRR